MKGASIHMGPFHSLEIEGPSTVGPGTQHYQALFDGQVVTGSAWSVSGNYMSIDTNGLLTVLPEASGSAATVNCIYKKYTATKEISVRDTPVLHTLEIGGPALISAETCQYVALYDGMQVVGATWSIPTGSSYATVDSNGLLSILPGASGSLVELVCEYGDLSMSKVLTVTYVSGSSAESSTESEVIVDPDTGQTIDRTTTTTVITDAQGNVTTETSTSETINNTDGSFSEVSTVVVENPDGSSTSESTTFNFDSEGTVTGSSTKSSSVATDGSSNSTTTNYNSEGEPESKVNENVDITGNVSTQDIEYDEEGEEVVTGYTIDTSASSGSGKQIEEGVNTEYYAFDVTRGFVLDIEFSIDFSNQPAGQDQNHHNILTAKRATPEPWYGFQLRQSSTNKYIQLGTQFSIGDNVNTKVDPVQLVGNVATYQLRITYDPTAASNRFVCRDVNSGLDVFVSDGVFPNLEELKYLKVVLGCATDASGNPYRYSNINVQNFSIVKLPPTLLTPSISCNGEMVTLECLTSGADIYYRLNQTGDYALYTEPIAITEDTVVDAYSELDGERSATVTQTCVYNPAHDYSLDYLTFRTLTSGTIAWKATGSGYNKVIQYSINDGAWTPLTASNPAATISVNENDVVRFKGSNGAYAGSKTAYAGFGDSTAKFDIEGNIMSLVYGDNFVGNTSLTSNYAFCSLFKQTSVRSAENLVLPATSLTKYCYRALLANCVELTIAPELPATSLNTGCYYYMFDWCQALASAPVLAAPTLAYEAYYGMFHTCSNLNYIKCLATDISATNCLKEWTNGVASAGTFVKEENTVWTTGSAGIPKNWIVYDSGSEPEPEPVDGSWRHNSQPVDLPYSINAIDGHSANYDKGTYSFTAKVNVEREEPTYLWFDHADQSADVYVNGTKVTTHWGGYNSFTVDITNYVHTGSNNIEVIVNNTTRNTLAPCDGDFNFNATLGKVEMITGSVLPTVDYGYDGFRVKANVTASSAAVMVETSIPSASLIECIIKSGSTTCYSNSKSGSGIVSFSAEIANPHLWDGVNDPFLYDVTLNVYHSGSLSFTATRPYGFRYFRYARNEMVSGSSYTGLLLNDHPYYLRGVCMHQDIDGKANALTSEDIAHDFSIIQELGCNFIRTAHYPHPREFYDWCDRLGIAVETEVPWVNKAQSTMPADYYTHLESQITDMVTQHYNHPSIFFWGLGNEIKTDDKDFAKGKVESFRTLIRSLDTSRWVGYVMSHSYPNGLGAFNNPAVDWIGQNMYVGWYQDTSSNNPTSKISSSLGYANAQSVPMGYSEYGCGGTQLCHSENPQSTTTRGTNQPRHDIEYMMWLHEGHIAAIKNFPELLFSSQWVLFDFAVTSRQEGYTICLDGENTATNDNLRRLNNKGLVERDHTTKKDPFYLYKAWWNKTDKFVHICGKDYQKYTGREFKCYTNDGSTLTLFVNNVSQGTATVTNNIAIFGAVNVQVGDTVRVEGATTNDSYTVS